MFQNMIVKWAPQIWERLHLHASESDVAFGPCEYARYVYNGSESINCGAEAIARAWQHIALLMSR
jgi:hypothetical protein